MKKECFIVEDLLPLYHEDLLHQETKVWLENHVKECKNCQELLTLTENPLETGGIHSTVKDKKMFQKINRRLSIYQLIFVALSLVLAMTTSMLNNSFHFILTYTILGVVTYLFYREIKLVTLITVIPLFLWYVGKVIGDYMSGDMSDDYGIGELIGEVIYGGVITALIHLIFSLVGCTIGFLILKIRESGENHEPKENHL